MCHFYITIYGKRQIIILMTDSSSSSSTSGIIITPHLGFDNDVNTDDDVVVALKESEAVFEDDIDSILDTAALFSVDATATEQEFDKHTEAVAKYKEIEARFKSTLDELLLVRSINNVRMIKAVRTGLRSALEREIESHKVEIKAAIANKNVVINQIEEELIIDDDGAKMMMEAGARVTFEETALRTTIVKFNRAHSDANRLYAVDMDALCKLKRVVDIMLKNYDEKDTVHSEHFGAVAAKRSRSA